MPGSPPLLLKGQYFGSAIRRRQILGFAATENAFVGHQIIPKHQHALTHLTCILSGGFTERYEDQTLDCPAGSLLVVPKDRIHDDLVWAEGAETLSIEIGPKTLEKLEGSASFLKEPQVLKSALIARTIERLVIEFRQSDEAALLAVGALAMELLSIAERSQKHDEPNAWMPELIEMLHRNPAQSASLSQFAGRFGISEATLGRTFRRLHGCSVAEYVRWLRLEQSKKLLVASDLSLAEIAIEVGFYDQAHFSREFKKLYGTAPSTYRAAMRT